MARLTLYEFCVTILYRSKKYGCGALRFARTAQLFHFLLRTRLKWLGRHASKKPRMNANHHIMHSNQNQLSSRSATTDRYRQSDYKQTALAHAC